MGFLEQEISNLLLTLAQAFEGSDEAKAILIYVGLDSLKHANLLEQSAKVLLRDVEVDLENCRDLVGTELVNLIKHIREETEELAKGPISMEEARKLIEEQTKMEGQLGEEYLNMCQAKALSLIATSEVVKKILELISEDEERHLKLLETALGYLP
ncbi:MAG: hypothetical protein DRN92_05635 [Thermoproteota archaeon]|nr:MAG: hypothetical protein DRN92_05635 [Candidatus Korarchaeota archaeon]